MADPVVIEFKGQLPGEAIVVEILKTIQVLAAGQTPEQRKALWDMYIEDVKNWRAFWKPFLDAMMPKT